MLLLLFAVKETSFILPYTSSEDFVMKGIPLGLSQLAHVSVYLQADRY
jgi:hypothetical protein